MKKSIVRLLSFTLALLFVFALIPFSPLFASTDYIVPQTGEGLSFSAGNDYQATEKTFDKRVATFEAVLHLPKSFDARAGAVFSNFDWENTGVIGLEIYNDGVPRIYIKSNGVSTQNVLFSDVDVRTDDNSYVHLAITLDETNNTLLCYLNGELKQTKTLSINLSGVSLGDKYAIGGDLRAKNEMAFKGKIRFVAVYSDVRSASEIQADMLSINIADENLLAAYDLSLSRGIQAYKDLSEKNNLVLVTNEGLTFSQEALKTNKNFQQGVVTVQTWIYAPLTSGRAGVIVGNYMKSGPNCLNIEIYDNGAPRFFYNGGGNLIFTEIDLRTGQWVHLSFVYDSGAKEVTCYVNGEAKQTLPAGTYSPTLITADKIVLGGDLRTDNKSYFKGRIKEIVYYSDARTPEEILQDMNSVNPSNDNLLAYYNLRNPKNPNYIEDLSGNGYDAEKLWFAEKEPPVNNSYSFAIIGDTQVLAKKDAIDGTNYFSYIYDWILENKESKNIQYVMGLGDITNDSTQEEWQIVKENITKLDGIVPYSLVRGNHDKSPDFNAAFGNHTPYTDLITGYYQEGFLENIYTKFSIGEVSYMVFTLDYGASDSILNWAGEIINANPDSRVIITTHCYLFRDGTTLDVNDVVPPNKTGDTTGKSNNGDQIWDKLISKHPNIFLVLSGHDPCDNVVMTQTKGDYGNIVTQMLIDPQGMDKDPAGMVAMLYFSEDGSEVSVEFYSTIKNQFYKNSNQYDFTLVSYEGNGVLKIEKAFRTENVDTYRVYYTNGTTTLFDVVNGLDGTDGKDGENGYVGPAGPKGLPGADGKDGTDGRDGTDGKDGTDGRDGTDGPQGLTGKDGASGKGADSTVVYAAAGVAGFSMLSTITLAIYMFITKKKV